MTFTNWKDMYEYLINTGDLYNQESGIYVFEYNDAHALCAYHQTIEQVKDIIQNMKETGEERWSALLGIGGEILDNPKTYSHETELRAPYLSLSVEFCKEHFAEEWIDTRDMEELLQMQTNEPDIDYT